MKDLKKKRLAKGMTQSDLAKKLKIDLRTVQRMEKSGKIRNCYLTDLKEILSCCTQTK